MFFIVSLLPDLALTTILQLTFCYKSLFVHDNCGGGERKRTLVCYGDRTGFNHLVIHISAVIVFREKISKII